MLCLFLGQQCYAQISSGGTPPSFFVALSSTLPTVELPPVDETLLLAEDSTEMWSGPDSVPVAMRFAFDHDVSLNLENSGVWEALADGTRLWRLRLESRGARSVHLLYDRWLLPKHARLYLYDDTRAHVIGAFTAENNWIDGTNITGPVRGDAITLEYVLSPQVRFEQRGELSISKVCHAYRRLSDNRNPLDMYGDSYDCQVNINCPQAEPFSDERRGVGMIISGGTRWCCGTLVLSTLRDGRPYFLTASHCLNGNQNNWLFIFNYESPECEDYDGPLDQSIANAVLRATWPYNAGSDFALLELSNSVPLTYNPFFNGWDRNDTPTPGTTGISHPHGDIKKYAFDSGTPTHDDWGSGPPNTHWRINYDVGGMETGSSGSPAFNFLGRVIGQLTGGYEACHIVDESWYGKFGADWAGGGTNATRLSIWLDPIGTNPDALDGSDPLPPSNDVCPGIYIPSLPFTYDGSTAYARHQYQGFCAGTAARDVVFYLHFPCTLNITASTCGSMFDTGLIVRTGPACPGSEQVMCNDDDSTCASPLTSHVNFEALANTTYYLIVDGCDSTSSGKYLLTVTGEPCPPQRLVLERAGNSVRLNWDAAPAAVSYLVHRLSLPDESPSEDNRIAEVTSTSFVDSGVLDDAIEICYYTVTVNR